MNVSPTVESRSGPVWLRDIFTKNEETGNCNCGRGWNGHVFCSNCRESCLFWSDFSDMHYGDHFNHDALVIRECRNRPVVRVRCMSRLLVDISGIQSYLEDVGVYRFIFLYREVDPPVEISSKKASIPENLGRRGDLLSAAVTLAAVVTGERFENFRRLIIPDPFVYCRKCNQLLCSRDLEQIMFCSLQCKMETARDDPAVTLTPRRQLGSTFEANISRYLLRNALYQAVELAMRDLHPIASTES